jgi:hypothetical protein
MATNPLVMGKFTISRRSRTLSWLATIVMGMASLGFISSLVFGLEVGAIMRKRGQGVEDDGLGMPRIRCAGQGGDG